MDDAPPPHKVVLDPAQQCRERLDLASSCFRAGEFRSSAAAALEAGELAKHAGRADLLAEAALVVVGLPDPAISPTVEQLCREALSAVDDDDMSLRARLHGQLAIALHHRGRLEEAGVEIERALTLASNAGDPLATAAALNARQLAMAGLGRGQELLELGSRMLDAAAASGSREVELQARNWRIDAFFRLGDTPGAAHEIDSLNVLAARSGNPLVGPCLEGAPGVGVQVRRDEQLPRLPGREGLKTGAQGTCAAPPSVAAFGSTTWSARRGPPGALSGTEPPARGKPEAGHSSATRRGAVQPRP